MLSFRFDIDTRAGLVERVPPLLDALEATGVRATFFCVMGPEANLAQIVRLRLLADRGAKSTLNVAQKGGLLAIAKAAAFPRGVGHRNPQLLREIVARGHELQPHGWSHILWQRALDDIDPADHLRRAMEAYADALGHPPTGFASPGRSCNHAALAAFDAAGLRYAGDLDGSRPFRPDGFDHLQLPITRFETIAQMRRRGLDDDAIVATYLDDVATHPDYACLYEHPDDLDPSALEVFRRVFASVVAAGHQPVTLTEVADAFEPRLT